MYKPKSVRNTCELFAPGILPEPRSNPRSNFIFCRNPLRGNMPIKIHHFSISHNFTKLHHFPDCLYRNVHKSKTHRSSCSARYAVPLVSRKGTTRKLHLVVFRYRKNRPKNKGEERQNAYSTREISYCSGMQQVQELL